MKKLTIFVLAIAMTLDLAQGAILDQAQQSQSGYMSVSFWGSSFVQTFTCGLSGPLDHIDLKICGEDEYTDPGYPTTVAILNTDNGTPILPTLGQLDNLIFEIGWNSIDFRSESIFLTAGTQYGIMIANDDTNVHDVPTVNTYGILGRGVDSYSGGSLWKGYPGAWENENDWIWDTSLLPADLCFRTYIVPEPATIFLLGLGAVMLRRKR